MTRHQAAHSHPPSVLNADTKPSTTHSSAGSNNTQEAHTKAPASRDKNVTMRKIVETANSATNSYGFINRNDTKEDVSACQTAVKKDPGSNCVGERLQELWGLMSSEDLVGVPVEGRKYAEEHILAIAQGSFCGSTRMKRVGKERGVGECSPRRGPTASTLPRLPIPPASTPALHPSLAGGRDGGG